MYNILLSILYSRLNVVNLDGEGDSADLETVEEALGKPRGHHDVHGNSRGARVRPLLQLEGGDSIADYGSVLGCSGNDAHHFVPGSVSCDMLKQLQLLGAVG